MTDYKSFLSGRVARRILILLFVALLLFLLRGMINMLLLTFIFAYLAYSAQKFIVQKTKIIDSKILKGIIILVYLGFLTLAGYILYKYIPIMITQLSDIIDQASQFYTKEYDNDVVNYLIGLSKDIKISQYLGDNFKTLFTTINNIGKWGFDIFVAVILSLFFILEKSRISRFTLGFKDSKISAIYEELAFFSRKFLESFGKVIKTQITISFINSILSVIVLSILNFPQVIGLGFMVFVLGLIPVAGVVISLIPLSIIAYTIGGIRTVIYVLVLIAILHAIESYILNPKLMSDKTKLPVFYTFIVLFLSEHIMGIWGLIIGIPIFMFILDVLEVKNPDAVPSQNKSGESDA
jgi:predicted PurR-regulated permease PerM